MMLTTEQARLLVTLISHPLFPSRGLLSLSGALPWLYSQSFRISSMLVSCLLHLVLKRFTNDCFPRNRSSSRHPLSPHSRSIWPPALRRCSPSCNLAILHRRHSQMGIVHLWIHQHSYLGHSICSLPLRACLEGEEQIQSCPCVGAFGDGPSAKDVKSR